MVGRVAGRPGGDVRGVRGVGVRNREAAWVAGSWGRGAARLAGRCRQGHPDRFGAGGALPPAPCLAPAGIVGAGLRLVVCGGFAAGSLSAGLDTGFSAADLLTEGLTAGLLSGGFTAVLPSGRLAVGAISALPVRLPPVAPRFRFPDLALRCGVVAVRVGVLRLDPAVVAPTNQDLQCLDPLAHEEAQPHRRGEEPLLRGPAVFRGVVPEPGPLRDLGLVVHVRIAALPDRRVPGDQEPGEIPVARPHPAR